MREFKWRGRAFQARRWILIERQRWRIFLPVAKKPQSPVGRRLFATWHCTLRTGSYSWRIVATDPAGNRTAGKWHFLDVYPGAHDRR